jgi:hypothetical protein
MISIDENYRDSLDFAALYNLRDRARVLINRGSSTEERENAAKTAALFGFVDMVHTLLDGLAISLPTMTRLVQEAVLQPNPAFIEEAVHHGLTKQTIDPVKMRTFTFFIVNHCNTLDRKIAINALRVILQLHSLGLIPPDDIQTAEKNAYSKGHIDIGNALHSLT